MNSTMSTVTYPRADWLLQRTCRLIEPPRSTIQENRMSIHAYSKYVQQHSSRSFLREESHHTLRLNGPYRLCLCFTMACLALLVVDLKTQRNEGPNHLVHATVRKCLSVVPGTDLRYSVARTFDTCRSSFARASMLWKTREESIALPSDGRQGSRFWLSGSHACTYPL